MFAQHPEFQYYAAPAPHWFPIGMRLLTTTTSSPDLDTSTNHEIDEGPIVVDIKKDVWGHSYYSLDEFKEKFNRTAVIKKPSDDERNKQQRTKVNDNRGFRPMFSIYDFNPRVIEPPSEPPSEPPPKPSGPPPKLPTTTTQYFSHSLGTRNFLPALVCFVGLLSLAMILIAIGKFAASRCRRKKRNSAETKVDQEGCWPSTYLPTAPPPDETSGAIAPVPDASLADPNYPPPNYESLFNVPSREESVNERLVTDTEREYASEPYAKDCENSMPLRPLLRSSETVDSNFAIADDLTCHTRLSCDHTYPRSKYP